MVKISERLMSTNKLREKRRDSCELQRVNLLAEDSICMANLLVIPQKIVVFYYMIDFFSCFRKEILFCQASMKIKMSPLSVHC